MTATEHSLSNRAGARGVQSGGGPRTPAHLDREAARLVVRRFVSPYLVEEDEETVIAAFEGCVRPVAWTIDRTELLLLIEQDSERESWSAKQFADRILALVRPVEGVVLTREEAALAREWFATLRNRQWETDADLALAARLEVS